MRPCVIFSVVILCIILARAQWPDGTYVSVFPCANNKNQQWVFQSDKTIRLNADQTKCLDISQYGTTNGSQIWLYSCHTNDKEPSHQNQEFDVKGSQIVSTLSNLCIQVMGTYPSSAIQTWTCNGQSDQMFTYDQNSKTIRVEGFCLDAGTPIPSPCEAPSNKGLPFCNTNLDFPTRVKDLVSRLNPTEKLALFDNGAGGVPRLLIPQYQWWSEALHGVAGSPGVKFQGKTPVATSFPQIIGIGAAFDVSLVAQMGAAISTEARGFNSEKNAGLTFWAPNINPYRDPRWGRGQETPGEDAYVVSQYAINFVSSMQGTDPKYLKVSSCCKHYHSYDLEDWNGIDRHHFDAIVSERDLNEYYLPSFQACVEGGKASSIMCSYNSVNGIPSCANKEYLNDLLRAKWNFQGYVTSDCGAVDDVLDTHHYTTTTSQTAKVTLEAGMDIDCGDFMTKYLAKAVSDGSVSEEDLDTALYNLFSVQFRLGMFDPDNVYTKINYTQVNTQPHQQLALQAAIESMVLLKNSGALPLNKDNVKHVAVVGPNGQATTTLQGNYYGTAPYLVSPQNGISKFAQTTYNKGCDIDSQDKSGYTAACNAARDADATVVVVGLDQSQEREGHDRTDINLPGVQNDFITQMGQCSRGPVIVVVMAGGQVDLSVPKNDPKISAILWVGYPGQSGGDAIAMTLFGTSPAGRLPYTIYPAAYTSQVSMVDMGLRPNATSGNPGRTYRFYTGTPVYPFGYGLSYTTFSFQWSTEDPLKVSAIQAENMIVGKNIYDWNSPVLASATVTVTNTGNYTSDVVVIAYITGPNPGKDGNPLTTVFGFKRLYSMKPQDKQIITFSTTAHDLSVVSESGSRKVEKGIWKIRVGDIEKEVYVV